MQAGAHRPRSTTTCATSPKHSLGARPQFSSTARHAASDFYRMAAAPPKRRPKKWQAPKSLQYDAMSRSGPAQLDWTPAGRNWLANCLNAAFNEIVVRRCTQTRLDRVFQQPQQDHDARAVGFEQLAVACCAAI